MSTKKKSPKLYIIAGPNGAGKTTFAKEFLPHYAKCENFVNADLIAGGLSPFSPEAAAMRAGRLLLEQIHLFFLWIPTVEMALARIADRVRRGGHDIPDIPEKVVRRRFRKGLQNLFTRYRPVLDSWMLFDNSGTVPRLIAREELGEIRVFDQALFARIRKG